jgi:protein phosphatase
MKTNGLHWKAMLQISAKKPEPATKSSNLRRKRTARKQAEELAFISDRGPFDIIGDVHGCTDELLELMAKLGYRVKRQKRDFAVKPPKGRKLAFVGDLANRGPATPQVLRLVMSMVFAGQAFCVPGNQDVQLARALKRRDTKVTRGVVLSLQQFKDESKEFRTEVAKFLNGRASHYVLDDGNLVIAHAGLKERLHGKNSATARKFAVNGQTTGKTDEFGLPVRYNWTADYRGKALVVYGHTPVAAPLWLNNTVDIDTGCVYGGYLTALRYPEREVVSVPAKAIYYPSRKRFVPARAASA